MPRKGTTIVFVTRALRFLLWKRAALVVGLSTFFVIIFLFLSVVAWNRGRTFSPERELARIVAATSSPLDAFRSGISGIFSRGGSDGAFAVASLGFTRGSFTIDECHTILHLVGHYAYARSPGDLASLARKDGLLCVSSFIHGVEAEIALEGAEQASPQLQNYCSELRKIIPGFFCYHGAGHAFFEARLDLPWALKRCDALAPGPEPDLSNCYRGVFSQYGSSALGVDGDTGLPLTGKLPITLDPVKPLLFCDTLASTYRPSCYSQLTKIHISRSGTAGEHLKGCLVPSYTREAQATCVNITEGVFSRSELSDKDTISPDPFVSGLSEDFRKKYIAGAAEGFLAQLQSGRKKDWNAFCRAFPAEDDQAYCLNFNPER